MWKNPFGTKLLEYYKKKKKKKQTELFWNEKIPLKDIICEMCTQ